MREKGDCCCTAVSWADMAGERAPFPLPVTLPVPAGLELATLRATISALRLTRVCVARGTISALCLGWSLTSVT